jgi:hypothetical protein
VFNVHVANVLEVPSSIADLESRGL